MKFYYGYDKEHYVNITTTVFEKCLKDNGIYIPASDDERREIVGYDPYPNIRKHILIIDHAGNESIYTSTKNVEIRFDSLTKQLEDAKNPKVWWNAVGKYIEDPVERLAALQKRINLHHFGHGGFEYEYPEQLMAMRHVKEDSRVLEIGGNIGRTAHIIHTIVNNPHNHVIMECEPEMASKLRHNLDLNTYTGARIETRALSKTKLYKVGDYPRPLDAAEVTADTIEMPSISYSELCRKYAVDFNVLVADCEGSLFYIFKEDPNMLDRIHTVIMENDYYDVDHKKMVDVILKMKGFKLVYQEKGVPWASWSCCYDYFYEVWKKDA